MIPKFKPEINFIKKGKPKNKLNIDNIKVPDKFFRKNLPELKLTNLKSRPGTESPDQNRNQRIGKNLTLVQTKEKISPIIPTKKNNSTNKTKEIPFPKFNSVKNKDSNELNFKQNYKIKNNFSSRWVYKFALEKENKISFNNNSPIRKENNKVRDNMTFFKKNFLNNEKIQEKDSSFKKNRTLLNNETLRIKNIKSKIEKIPRKGNLLKFQKLKIVKNNSSNALKKNDIFIPFSTKFNPFQGFYNNFPSILQTNEKNNSKIELKEIKTDRDFYTPNKQFNVLKNYSPLLCDGIVPIQDEEINIDSEIFEKKYNNFEVSLTSYIEDIKEKDFIKGYAYNSCIGNIREKNEDAINVRKIYFDNDINNYCYYFAIFDGHGGRGCANYLKENLHKNIKEFSLIGLKIAVDVTEEKFKFNEAIDENNELKDSSGSCGLILLIKGKKCIISNIGDSRLVIFKNGLVEFSTIDHKPDSIIEKARIQLAGGEIYKDKNPFSSLENKIEMPWRISPGKLNVTRTFGDIKVKDEKFGGSKTSIVALPDITEINLDDDYNFIVMGCDGIFDVIKNEELIDCFDVVIKENKMTEEIKAEDIHKICGDFNDMIIKSALSRNSFDNLSCISIALNLNGLLPIEEE